MHPQTVTPNPWMLLPFGLLLSTIALAPIFFPGWWERHYPKVSYSLGAITVGYYVLGWRAYERVLHVGHDYTSFIVLIGSLFVISGGIHINVKGQATPLANTFCLFVGAVVANLLGTTGASMLLIRPWIRMNKCRITAHHIVFFIFIVSNVGGCLTPVGDPPLFLGYLQGVPFWWVAAHCWRIWLMGVGFLLALFYVLDTVNYHRAPREVRLRLAEPHDQWRFEGLWNLAYLLVVLAAVFVDRPAFLREALMIAAALASWFTTPKQVHEANHFNLHPFREVAILFAGIFATLMPALDWLRINADKLGSPGTAFFYWGTGLLSSFLDNAPTYLSFLSAAQACVQKDYFPGSDNSNLAIGQAQMSWLLGNPDFSGYLLAISIGAVFFGANTYIGNGPNFMVKSIADQQKVRMPGFLGLIFKYSLPCMGPILVLIWLLFFR